jgi:hypothetical protein
MNRKMIIYKDLMETIIATRFNLISKDDYSFRHSNCLHLRNTITNEIIQLIWRKKTLEIIPTNVNIEYIQSIVVVVFFYFSRYQLGNICINLNVIQCLYNLIL